MIRILYLIDNYSLGGAQIVVKGILENQPGDSVSSVALRKKVPVMEIQKGTAITLNSTSRFSIMPLFFLRRFIRLHQIEIIHCQLPRSVVFGFLLKVLFFKDIIYIIHEQGDIFESWVYATALRVIAHRADGIIACSRATSRKLEERAGIPRSKINVIYNFVDMGRFTPALQHSTRSFNIGFAGRIERRKGWREFLKVAEILGHKKNIKFFLAGTGTEMKQMERTIKDTPLPNVEYLRYVSDMSGFYNNLSLLIVPSYIEPMGMVAIEAMACGVPVIASNVEGLNELVSVNTDGWLVAVHGVEQIARHIEDYAGQTTDYRQEISRNALLKASMFSYTTFEPKLQQYHKWLMRNHD